MKHYSLTARRWSPWWWQLRLGAVLVISLLLFGVNLFSVQAAPAGAPATPTPDERAAAPAAPDILPSNTGLWGWWRFDDASDIHARDAASPPNPGMLGGDGAGNDLPEWKTDELALAPEPVANVASLYFDGAYDVVTVPPIDDLVAPHLDISNNASFTLAAWVKWEGGNGAVFWQGTNTNYQGLYLGIHVKDALYPKKGTLECGFWGDTPVEFAFEKADAWHHVACTADHSGNNRSLYIDGEWVAGNQSTTWYSGSGDLWIGRRNVSAGWGFKGYIDEPRVYTRALSSTEVRYLSGNMGPTCAAKAIKPDNTTTLTFPLGNAIPVQRAITWLGSAGGKVQISGTCTGVTRIDHDGYLDQTAMIYGLNAGATVTLEGGWNDSFTTQNPWTYPAVLDAASLGRVVFATETGSVVLKDLTLQNGKANMGGAVYTSITSMTLNNVKVLNSTATTEGGGVAAWGNLTVQGLDLFRQHGRDGRRHLRGLQHDHARLDDHGQGQQRDEGRGHRGRCQRDADRDGRDDRQQHLGGGQRRDGRRGRHLR